MLQHTIIATLAITLTFMQMGVVPNDNLIITPTLKVILDFADEILNSKRVFLDRCFLGGDEIDVRIVRSLNFIRLRYQKSTASIAVNRWLRIGDLLSSQCFGRFQ